MADENPENTGPEKGTIPAGIIDEETKKIYTDMQTRVSEVPAYIQLLKTGNLLERVKSAEFLGEIGDERGVLPLIEALIDSSTTVQYVAAKSLGLLGDKRAVNPLIALLTSEDKWVRLGAAQALGRIGDKKAVDAIIPLLTDTHHDLRAHAAGALGKLGDTRAVEPLKLQLNDPKEDVRIEVKKDSRNAGGEKQFMTLLPQKSYEQVKEDLKNYLQEMDLEIAKEFDTDDSCGFWIKFGDLPLLVENRKPLKYCVVALQITLSDETILKTLNDYYDRQDHQFIFRLTQVLTSPQTSLREGY